MSAVNPIQTLNLGDGTGDHSVQDADAIYSIKVNGAAQSVSNNAVDLNIYNNMFTDSNWTAISALYS
jgi:hypothetical protein